ncbi:MAG: hypothetical protein ABEI78_02355 [Candidatus Nanohaloarchaea archaeon]
MLEQEENIEIENLQEETVEDYTTIKITSEVPEFMGTDLETYGPFNEGDKARLPEENAEILVNRGNAERIEKVKNNG